MDDASQLDLNRAALLFPEGPSRGSDLAGMVVATVTGLDIASGQVEVTVSGSDPVWVPAAPFIYEAGAKVRIRRSPIDGGRLEYCEGPLTAAPMLVTGTILAIGAETLTVRVLGEEVELLASQSTYEVGDPVIVMRHPTGFGIPQGVLGIAGLRLDATNPGEGTGNPGQTQQRQATIGPQDSGTFSSRFGRWGAWSAEDWRGHGGVASLWQGEGYGSGALHGWAGYGDQVANLHASSITRMWVDIIRADTADSAGRVITVQGSPDGTRPAGAPSSSGGTASTGAIPSGGSQRIELPSSTYEAWRTGGFKGLKTVGGQYAAAAGTNRGGAMVLTVQYEVVA